MDEATLLEELGSGEAAVRQRAVEALAQAMLQDAQPSAQLLDALRATGAEGRQAAMRVLAPPFRQADDVPTIERATALLRRLADAKLVGASELDTARCCLVAKLDRMPGPVRPAAVDALLELGMAHDDVVRLLEAASLPALELTALRRQVYARPRPAAVPDASDRGIKILAVVRVVIILAVAAPLVVVAAVWFTVYPIAVSIVAALALLGVALLAYFWWRCPACKRPFAGERVHRELRSGTGTAQVRDVLGVSHSVQTRRVSVVTTYRCRRCGEVFMR